MREKSVVREEPLDHFFILRHDLESAEPGLSGSALVGAVLFTFQFLFFATLMLEYYFFMQWTEH